MSLVILIALRGTDVTLAYSYSFAKESGIMETVRSGFHTLIER